jgi:putative SOS response-associated peptidase YedK
MLLPYYSIGSDAVKIETHLTAEFLQHFDPVFVSRTGMSLPVILPGSAAKISSALWGIPVKNTYRLPWIKPEGIVKNRKTRYIIRKQRCLVPANGIFLKRAEEYYFIYFPDQPVFTMGGIFTCRKYGNDQQVTEFSILTQSPVTALGKLTPIIPLIISTGSRRRYLNRERPLMDITHMLQKELKLNFNGLQVSPEIFRKKSPDKMDFDRKNLKLFTRQKFPEKEILGSYYFY